MVILDVSIVNVALPSIRADLGFSAVDLQWVVNAYALTFAGFLLLGGRAADLLGRRRVLIGGLALFTLASLVGALSSGQATLVIARAVQGLGGAVVAPATLSLLTTSFPEGRERNRALALWGAVGGVGGAAGVLLGGLLTELLGWQSILLINVPMGIAAVLAARWVIAPVRGTGGSLREFDLAGALTITAGLVLLTLAIVRTDVNGWGSPATLLVGGAGLALVAAFVVIEARLAARPLVPFSIFRSRTLVGANLVVFTMGAAAFSMWFLVSLYLQEVKGYSALHAGLAFLPMNAALILASSLAARVSARVAPGAVLAVGMTLLGVGLLGFSRLQEGSTYALDLVPPAVVAAFGLGWSFVPVTILATAGVRGAEAGLASGIVNTARQFGGALGLAVLATVATSRSADVAGQVPSHAAALAAGFDRAFELGALFALAGALAALVMLVPRPAGQRRFARVAYALGRRPSA